MSAAIIKIKKWGPLQDKGPQEKVMTPNVITANCREKHMHTCNLYTQTHFLSVTHLQWPSTLLFLYCKLPLTERSRTFGDVTVLKTEAVQWLTNSGQVCRWNKEVRIWNTLAPKNRKRHSPEIKSVSLQNVPWISIFLLKNKFHIFQISYILWNLTHSLNVHDMCTYEALALPPLGCTSYFLSYNYLDI